jgi:hypothetical protein
MLESIHAHRRDASHLQQTHSLQTKSCKASELPSHAFTFNDAVHPTVLRLLILHFAAAGEEQAHPPAPVILSASTSVTWEQTANMQRTNEQLSAQNTRLWAASNHRVKDAACRWACTPHEAIATIHECAHEALHECGAEDLNGDGCDVGQVGDMRRGLHGVKVGGCRG